MAVVTRRSFEQSLLDKSDWGEVTWEALLVFFSTYAAPILFVFTFFSIAETLFDTPKWYDFSVLVCQVFGLDSAGAGLVTRGMRLCERGKGKVGAWAIVAGGFIVLVTVVSVACVAIPSAIPTAVVWTKPTEAILIIVRVVGSVCYGFILKLVKGASGDHPRQSSTQGQQTTQQMDTLKTTIDNLSAELKTLASQKNSVSEPINYQKIADYVASLVPAQSVPEPLDYQEIAQNIVPLLIPPPVPTKQEIIQELKPYLDSLKPVVKSVLERNTQTDLPAVHPFLVPIQEKKEAIYVPPTYNRTANLGQSGQQERTPNAAKTRTPESVRSTVRQDAPRTSSPVQDGTDKNVRKNTGRTPESVRKSVQSNGVQDSTDTLLKRGYEDMLRKKMEVSGRKLAVYTSINKNIACAWYKDNVQQNQDSENEGVQDAMNQ